MPRPNLLRLKLMLLRERLNDALDAERTHNYVELLNALEDVDSDVELAITFTETALRAQSQETLA